MEQCYVLIYGDLNALTTQPRHFIVKFQSFFCQILVILLSNSSHSIVKFQSFYSQVLVILQSNSSHFIVTNLVNYSHCIVKIQSLYSINFNNNIQDIFTITIYILAFMLYLLCPFFNIMPYMSQDPGYKFNILLTNSNYLN